MQAAEVYILPKSTSLMDEHFWEAHPGRFLGAIMCALKYIYIYIFEFVFVISDADFDADFGRIYTPD